MARYKIKVEHFVLMNCQVVNEGFCGHIIRS